MNLQLAETDTVITSTKVRTIMRLLDLGDGYPLEPPYRLSRRELHAARYRGVQAMQGRVTYAAVGKTLVSDDNPALREEIMQRVLGEAAHLWHRRYWWWQQAEDLCRSVQMFVDTGSARMQLRGILAQDYDHHRQQQHYDILTSQLAESGIRPYSINDAAQLLQVTEKMLRGVISDFGLRQSTVEQSGLDPDLLLDLALPTLRYGCEPHCLYYC